MCIPHFKNPFFSLWHMWTFMYVCVYCFCVDVSLFSSDNTWQWDCAIIWQLYWGSSLQLWPGIEPATSQYMGWTPINLDTPARLFFIFLILLFQAQNFLFWCSPVYLFFCCCPSMSYLRHHCLIHGHRGLHLCFFLRGFPVLTRPCRPAIPFVSSYLCVWREVGANLTLLHVTIQLSQQHLWKRSFFSHWRLLDWPRHRCALAQPCCSTYPFANSLPCALGQNFPCPSWSIQPSFVSLLFPTWEITSYCKPP